MTLKKYEKIALLTAGPCVAATGLFMGWSANYAAASFFVLKSTAMGHAFFGGDLLMPAKQFAAYAADTRISRIATIAGGATAVEAAALGVGAFLLVKQPWAVKPPADGSRFAALPDLKKAGLLDGKPGTSILLGTFGKGKNAPEIRYSGDSHFFVNGPSRSGKGCGFVMTNLLEYQGSAIVLDVKLENWEKTGPARLAMGQKCFVFAPGSKFTHRWNPLDFVRDWPERSTDLLNLSASLIPLDEKETSIWKQTARSLFAGVLGYVLESETMEGRRNLRSALRMFSSGGSFSEVIFNILQNEPDLNGFIKDTFRQHLGRDEEQRPSFEGNVTTSLSPFNNLLMAEATGASDFDIRELRQYVEREGWGRAGGMLLSKQASQGRFELIPRMDVDAVLRLDDNSTILQIRGTYGAVLNKLNFYADQKFVDWRKQVAAYAARMPKPELELTPEWPLFQERPPQEPDNTYVTEPVLRQPLPPLGVSRAVEPVSDRQTMDDEATDIIDLARSVYRNVDRFTQVFRDAVAALDSDAAAHLLQNLRVQPDYYGPLIGEDGAFNIRGKRVRNRALAAIPTLRAAIIRSRRGVMEERARFYVVAQQHRQHVGPQMVSHVAATVGADNEPVTGLSTPDTVAGFTEAETSASTVTTRLAEPVDPDDPFAEHALIHDQDDDPFVLSIGSPESVYNVTAEEDDNTRIDFGFADATAHVAAVRSITQGAIRAGGVSDVEKLSGALSRMSASLFAVTSDEPWTMASIQLDQAAKSRVA